MDNQEIRFRPIGFIRTPFKKKEGTPIQPIRGKGVVGSVELLPEYADGLSDLDGFSHIILIYHLHLSSGFKLKVIPFLDDRPRGLFATRAPRRPNPIGISVVRLKKIEGNILHIENMDMIDGTPLLDIKPHVPYFQEEVDYKIGWLEGKLAKAKTTDADDRFGGE